MRGDSFQSLLDDDVQSREQQVIDWQLSHMEWGFIDNRSADPPSNAEKELLDVWDNHNESTKGSSYRHTQWLPGFESTKYFAI